MAATRRRAGRIAARPGSTRMALLAGGDIGPLHQPAYRYYSRYAINDPAERKRLQALHPKDRRISSPLPGRRYVLHAPPGMHEYEFTVLPHDISEDQYLLFKRIGENLNPKTGRPYFNPEAEYRPVPRKPGQKGKRLYYDINNPKEPPIDDRSYRAWFNLHTLAEQERILNANRQRQMRLRRRIYRKGVSGTLADDYAFRIRAIDPSRPDYTAEDARNDPEFIALVQELEYLTWQARIQAPQGTDYAIAQALRGPGSRYAQVLVELGRRSSQDTHFVDTSGPAWTEQVQASYMGQPSQVGTIEPMTEEQWTGATFVENLPSDTIEDLGMNDY